MSTATLERKAPTKVFLERWTVQLVPFLVKQGTISADAGRIIEHWLKETVAEMEGRPGAVAAPQEQREGPWSPDEITERLATDPQVTHVVFGAIPGARGHRIQGVRGPDNASVVRFADSELQRKGLFLESWDGFFDAKFSRVPFQVRATAPLRVGGVVVMKLCYNDQTGDSREGSHTDYTVGFPADWGPKIIPTFFKSPECLIRVFQRVFPEMDRTKGLLRMDPSWQKYYMKCAEYDQQGLWPSIERLNWN